MQRAWQLHVPRERQPGHCSDGISLAAGAAVEGSSCKYAGTGLCASATREPAVLQRGLQGRHDSDG